MECQLYGSVDGEGMIFSSMVLLVEQWYDYTFCFDTLYMFINNNILHHL